jgi:hypothetical protein
VKTQTELKLLELSPMERAMYKDFCGRYQYATDTVCNTLCKSYATAAERALSVVFETTKKAAFKYYALMVEKDPMCYSDETKESYRLVAELFSNAVWHEF